MQPEHKILQGHANGFTRFNFLKKTGDKTNESNIKLVQENIAEKRERRNAILKDKEEEYKA